MIGLVWATEAGRRMALGLAEAWPFECTVHSGSVREQLARAWAEGTSIVAFLAAGATVRLVAPLLSGKQSDPGVVCVDEAGRYAVALLGGHGSGANALAERVAEVLGAQAIVTTATDSVGFPGLDMMGFKVANPERLAAVSRAMLDGLPIAWHSDNAWPVPALPPNVGDHPGARHAVYVTDHRLPVGDSMTLRRPPLDVGLAPHAAASDADAAAGTDAIASVDATGRSDAATADTGPGDALCQGDRDADGPASAGRGNPDVGAPGGAGELHGAGESGAVAGPGGGTEPTGGLVGAEFAGGGAVAGRIGAGGSGGGSADGGAAVGLVGAGGGAGGLAGPGGEAGGTVRPGGGGVVASGAGPADGGGVAGSGNGGAVAGLVGAGGGEARGEGDGGAGGGVLVLHPPSLVLGIGASRGVAKGEIAALVDQALAGAGLAAESVRCIATADIKASEAGLVEFGQERGWAIVTYPAAELAGVEVPHPSEVVREAVGTPSVSEAAALLTARLHGRDAQLVVPKTVSAMATVAVARLAPRGRLAIVGLGPGAADLRTPRATTELRRASIVVGLDQYIDQIRHLLRPGTRLVASGLGAEEERARCAVELAREGNAVALIGSGDAGIYAMASPALEFADKDLEIHVVPGVTAALAASALLGAPLGHDHVYLSLSDLHTPWQAIERRLHAAAESDLVVCLYNPRSSRRTHQLPEALAILGKHRSPETPVGLVRNASREGQRISRSTLATVDPDEVDMNTVVIVGSSTTRDLHGRMVTPRGYRWSS